MTELNTEEGLIYKGCLHWVIFVWPLVVLILALALGFWNSSLRQPGYLIALLALLWEGVSVLTYLCTFLLIKPKQVILCSGILSRQIIDIPMSKIESIDIRQSVMGSLFQYGSLVITGTGGTRQYINFLNKPLTCRRYIEQTMYG